ncbi:Hypothetical predicted protein [Octopus vulgaris]|uniref:Uncharacterized protein n=2 Tax=Octopus TaxID=6643 RepID=A0AA36BQ46_OCTVU|nr:BLOC-1-related complex subunit 5 isoform X1 [Octopus sinensis]XP_036367646.1 BLOC-1-related complex subunit 5 isoform X1 [Octopus sinensis]XP_036367648.1 BLOC-1-related complex subunit 5 isoform X1 [Octopus sinensis]XP_036367649.1 BLOC-1-related complex subunit 5 isoform X1 [Octopus sinensis]CAI9738279.1 Hypothetical predicted protein [Octopus vulgaris]
MGSEQSSLPAGAPGSSLRSQRDEDIPYTTYSISKPIDGVPKSPNSSDDEESPRSSPRSLNRQRQVHRGERQSTPKHDIVIVAEGGPLQKDPDPEQTKLNAIPVFQPVLKRSINGGRGEMEYIDKLDHRQVLLLCLRYQQHLKQLSEAVAFDQNALCIRVKEIDYMMHVLLNSLTDRQRKYAKYTEQFQRVSETLSILNRIKGSIDNIIPKMERLNQMLPETEQLEPFTMKSLPSN